MALLVHALATFATCSTVFVAFLIVNIAFCGIYEDDFKEGGED